MANFLIVNKAEMTINHWGVTVLISFYSEKDKTPHQSSLLITNTGIICLICMFRFASHECDNFTDRKQLLMFASSHRAFCDVFNRHIKIEMRCLVEPPACSAGVQSYRLWNKAVNKKRSTCKLQSDFHCALSSTKKLQQKKEWAK